MRRVLTSESGSALVSAVLVMVLMLTFGLATFSYAGGQQGQARNERVGESSFDLGEAVLNSAAAFLSYQWPGATSPYPPSCTQASTGGSCPDAAGVTGGLDGADFAPGEYSWSTEVHDNGAPSSTYYSDQSTRSQPAYDANDDGSVWVRAEALVRGKRRALVALVKSERIKATFPANAITAGFFGTSNSGRKRIVDTAGNPPGNPGTLAVRCTAGGAPPNSCLNYSPSKGQVFPDTRLTGYAGGNALPASDLDILRKRAQSSGTYSTTSCPASLTGLVVFIEGPANCSYTGNSTFNSATGTQPGPGIVVVANGTLTLGGNVTFHGLVYAPNQQGSTGNVVMLQGTAQVVGAISVDGGGGLLAGSSKLNLIFERNVFNVVTSVGAVGVIQGSWRQLYL